MIVVCVPRHHCRRRVFVPATAVIVAAIVTAITVPIATTAAVAVPIAPIAVTIATAVKVVVAIAAIAVAIAATATIANAITVITVTIAIAAGCPSFLHPSRAASVTLPTQPPCCHR